MKSIVQRDSDFSSDRRRRIKRHVLAVAASAILLLAAKPVAAASTLLPGYFLGQAVGIEAQASIGPVALQVGNASAVGCPCRGTNGSTLTNSVSSLSVGAGGTILTEGVSTSTAYGLKTPTTALTKQTTEIAKINLLSGLITASVIKAVANVSVAKTSLTPTSTGTSFTDLVIAGTKIPANVAPNTVIGLPGIGSVTVNFVSASTYGTLASGVEVEALRVEVLEAHNSFGLSSGSVIIVGEAFASYNRTQPAATLGGYSESLAVTADAGTLLQDAAAAGSLSGIPNCLGTSGQTITNSVANILATGLLSVNAAKTTAYAGTTGKSSMAKTTATVANISLLGLVTADSIVAVAQETRNGTTSIPSTTGTSFGGLSVAGLQIASNIAPNTVITLPLLGYIVLNEQPAPVNGTIQVNGIHVVITLSNVLNLPIGAQIFLAHAEATAAAF